MDKEQDEKIRNIMEVLGQSLENGRFECVKGKPNEIIVKKKKKGKEGDENGKV